MKNVILELSLLQKEIGELASPAEQVRKIVDSISAIAGCDVCSLYLQDQNNDLVLMASHGLTHTGPVTIPSGRGLVGLVVKSRHPINIPKASEHPDFYYVEGSSEERFQSFCGIPLVRYGKVIGVLVVQSVNAEALSPESEGFLVTLSSQLAHLVADMPLSLRGAYFNTYLRGVKGSSGIGIGQAVLCDHGDLFSVPDEPCSDIDGTILEWHALLRRVQQEIKQEENSLGKLLNDSVSSIFSTYSSLLDDQALIGKVEQEIRNGNWLPGALRKSVQYFADLFLAMEDPYLRARHEDIHHLGNKLLASLQSSNSLAERAAQIPHVVLIGAEVSISDIAAVPGDKLAGIICFGGSTLSHTAVLANALGVPAVMGVGLLKNLRNRERFIVDGNSGQIVRYPTDMLCAEFQHLIDEERQLLNKLSALRELPALTPDGFAVRLFTNSGLLADLSPGLRHGAQGIGLYRTEIPFMVRDSFPSEQDQELVYRQVFEAYAGKPVYMRTLDIGGDKQLPYFPIDDEANPALGWRGIRFTLDNIQLLMTQVRAMLRAAGDEGDLHILLPMVSATEELTTFTELLDEALKQLREEGVAARKPKTGVMVEVPAAIAQLPFWRRHIDFVSIGSNDLSQYLLALDRNNARVANRYDHIHPAVIQELYRVVRIAGEHHLPLSLCGEMASDPLAVILLVGMGISTLSMSATKLPRIKYLIRALPQRRAAAIFKQCLSLDNVQDIRALLHETLRSLNLGELVK
ncbi:MAG: phosphoenolpyruvate--protein phosphotransferase [Pseudomonadales bacterium]|jgi:phosphotransferase system enzyme I (PtsI)/phosphotransferase system enzyme I (PtsP)|nr:phosphoenolpyruvate--protein phosphotransferase [Pseudomonadales bacterium]